MKIFVLTNRVRILDPTYDQIKYNIYYDTKNDPHSCYIDLLNKVKDLDDDILILEDDLILCKNFTYYINESVKKFPNMILNFFWQPLRNIKTTIEYKGFCYTQCVFYPKGIINKFYNDLKYPDFSYAKNIRQAIEKNNISFVNVRPHYVQHIGDKSLIWKDLCVRRSNMFIDDIKE